MVNEGMADFILALILLLARFFYEIKLTGHIYILNC